MTAEERQKWLDDYAKRERRRGMSAEEIEADERREKLNDYYQERKGKAMTAEEIKKWRDDYYNALVEITQFDHLNLAKELIIEDYKHMAYDCSDAEIAEMAKYNTPIETAEFETM